jgi:hypothetical protein
MDRRFVITLTIFALIVAGCLIAVWPSAGKTSQARPAATQTTAAQTAARPSSQSLVDQLIDRAQFCNWLLRPGQTELPPGVSAAQLYIPAEAACPNP